MDINYELIGLRIRQIRKQRDLTQEELSEMVDISTVFLSQIERGKKHASLNVLCKLAGMLKVPLDELVFGEVGQVSLPPDEWTAVLCDCSAFEREVILQTAKTLKKVLGRSRFGR